MARCSSFRPAGRVSIAGGSFFALLFLASPARSDANDPADQQQAQPVATIVVSDKVEKHTGSEADGYRVGAVGLGPLGARSVLDLPFSAETVPQDLIENQQVDANWQLLKYLPSTQIEYRGGQEIGRPQSRGFQADLLGNTRIDGFAVQSHIPQPIELTDHLDVVNGLAATLYGPMNPAGVFNYVLKRPTEENRIRAGIAFQSDGNLTERIDAGGRFGSDAMFGYRFNLAHTDGETYNDRTNLRREVAGMALDARLTPSTLLEVNAARYIYDQSGYPSSFALPAGTASRLPSAPDAAKAAYGQDWASSEVRTNYYGARLTQQLGADWSVSGGLMRQDVTRIMRSASNALSASGNSYTVGNSETFLHAETTSNQLYLNGKADTFGIGHTLAVGTNGYYAPSFSSRNAVFAPPLTGATGCGVYDPASCQVGLSSAWGTDGGFYRTGASSTYQSLTVSDTVAFTEQWSVMGTLANGWIENRTAAGVTKTISNAPSFSVGPMFKPAPNQTIWASYAESVLPGESIPAGNVNAGDFLDPYSAKQWELGYKVALSGIDLGVTAFRIMRPTVYASGGVYQEQGEQKNNGIEVMSKGKLTDDITVFGGATWLDTRVTGTRNAATEGQRAVGVPAWQANLLTEYTLPRSLVPDTVASLNLHYTGKRAANSANTAWADGYNTVDIGLRYTGEMVGRKIAARVGVTNLFDQQYWASIFPGSINGNTTAGSTAHMGEPRTVRASVTMDF